MKIGIIHHGKAFLPEIVAYKEFFEKNGLEVSEFISPKKNQLQKIDIEWHLMGYHFEIIKTRRFVIHEYISPSVPPFAEVKNLVKKIGNSRPNLRIFGNEKIKEIFNKNDNVPFLFRGVGIGDSFYVNSTYHQQEFDFVYSGSTDKIRNIQFLIEVFIENFPKKSLLIIGNPPPNLPLNILKNPRLCFTGKIPYNEVPLWLSKAKYGINFIPDKFPFNAQASLKSLEYCAVGLPVITTDYAWVKKFESERNAKFFKINQDLNNFTESNLLSYNFITPDVSDLRWNNVLTQSGILKFIFEKFFQAS